MFISENENACILIIPGLICLNDKGYSMANGDYHKIYCSKTFKFYNMSIKLQYDHKFIIIIMLNDIVIISTMMIIALMIQVYRICYRPSLTRLHM